MTNRRTLTALAVTAVGIAVVVAAHHGLFIAGVPGSVAVEGDGSYDVMSLAAVASQTLPQPLAGVALQVGVVVGAASLVWPGFVAGRLPRVLQSGRLPS